ncbi:hypothetical protein [Prauserella rugosa]|uniref:Uncharacterized protein n=1 Tax=Prauserella rugosa TaxID=43354 RepID=A0A660CCV1_9PSEU|nr:hypothetical protein [Prauserella rugosa]KID29349.1 hypothetical protein HQ32_03221 [Prauserella sp. Am3]KMS84049.1 hypothetical protein ACZ91_49905 [Streptomyces regensis]TWH21292.1 hypothetical protein JD82_03151 [Prauserella rugosa]
MNRCVHGCAGLFTDPDLSLAAELRRLVLDLDRMPDGLVERVQTTLDGAHGAHHDVADPPIFRY